MSQDVYVFSICILKNYFKETFGDHYPYEIIMGIIMVLRDSKVLDLKIELKSAIHELSFMNENILQMAQCSLNTELSSLITSYYPVFHTDAIEMQNSYVAGVWKGTKILTNNTRRWFCQIVDGLGSEESLYELAMAGHTWVAEYKYILFGSERYHFSLFIDCIPTSYKSTPFTIPETSWFE
jgi:hypothetical protein